MSNQQPVPADPRLRRQFDNQSNSQSPDSQVSPNQQPKVFNPFNQQGRIDPRLQRNSSLPLPNLSNSTNTKIVFIGNVEYCTTESDIVGFFADIAPPPEGVYFVKNARGQPCGDCYVKFRNADDATRALIKNRFRFRSRVIRVTLAEADDASKALGFSLTNNDDGGKDNANEISGRGSAIDEPASEQNDNNDMDMDGLNPSGQSAERDGDNDQNGDGSNGGGNQFSRDDPRMMYNNAPYSRGGNIGDRAGNMMNMGNNYNRGGRGAGGGGSDNNRGMRGNYNRNNNSNNNSNGSSNNNGNNQRNLEGCIVGLSNVPFAATPRDIADFFGEYNLTPNDIIRRYNDDGSLTGEARVRFLTPMDASKAIDRHQRERIGNRVIHLRLVT